MRSSWGGAKERPIAGEGEDGKERQAWRREKGRHGGHRRTSSLQLARVLGWEHQESSRKTTLWPSGWMRSRADEVTRKWWHGKSSSQRMLPSLFIPYQHLTEVRRRRSFVRLDGWDLPATVFSFFGLSFFNRVSLSGFRMKLWRYKLLWTLTWSAGALGRKRTFGSARVHGFWL
jgi:hypothetical protein